MVGLPRINSAYIKKQDYFLIFETRLFDKNNYMSYIFVNPVKIIKIYNLDEVEKVFKEIEEYAKDSYLAGYFAYELGYYFERDTFVLPKETKTPLIHLAVFKKRLYFDHRTGKNNIDIPLFYSKGNLPGFNISEPKPELREKDYCSKILRIKNYIRKGDTYQVNFTTKYNFNFTGSEFAFYNELAKRQRVQYSSFCKLGNQKILSLSPELFFKRDGLKIYSQPMKGTIARGLNLAQDCERVRELKESVKNRAENLMIVDLVRNDLGRVSNTSSIKVSEAFKIRKYDTIFQMTSEVKGILKNNTTYLDIFKNLFPGGSVTGAPKIRTMQIINELEKTPRGLYCGALGFISPGNKAIFNLPIRTVSISDNKAVMGVGSGIVYDSSSKEELRECRLKANFLTPAQTDFELIETMLWENGYKFLKLHILRLKDSAEYFSFAYSQNKIRALLKKIESNFLKGSQYRVRLLLFRDGSLNCGFSKIPPQDKVNYITVSKYRVNSENAFLYHKTTNRKLYDEEYEKHFAQGYFDVIFLNTRNEFTEGAISNIIIKKGNNFYTPPASCGLLPGVYRKYLIDEGRVKEKILRIKDIKGADKLYLCNSVRKMVEVNLK
jgi:para-aminobenzoate synthetase/4-amino-4-deoxychorismate lyase